MDIQHAINEAYKEANFCNIGIVYIHIPNTQNAYEIFANNIVGITYTRTRSNNIWHYETSGLRIPITELLSDNWKVYPKL